MAGCSHTMYLPPRRAKRVTRHYVCMYVARGDYSIARRTPVWASTRHLGPLSGRPKAKHYQTAHESITKSTPARHSLPYSALSPTRGDFTMKTPAVLRGPGLPA